MGDCSWNLRIRMCTLPRGTVFSPLCCHDTIPDRNDLIRERFVLDYGFSIVAGRRVSSAQAMVRGVSAGGYSRCGGPGNSLKNWCVEGVGRGEGVGTTFKAGF